MKALLLTLSVLHPAPAIDAVETPAFLWSTAIKSISDSTPAVGPDGAIYFGTFDGRMWALNSNGTERWVFRAGLEIRSSPALAPDGSLYFGSRDRFFYCLFPNGKEKWRLRTGAWVDSSPAIARDGTVYFGSWDQSFYAVRPTGGVAWKFKSGACIDSSPAIALDGTIYFGSHDGFFYALNPDGTVKWQFRTGGPIISSPAILGGESVCFTSVDGCAYSLQLDGTIRWKVRTGGITASSPVVRADGTTFLVANDKIWFISPTGTKIFARDAETLDSSSPTLTQDNSYILLTGMGNLLKERLEPHELLSFMGLYIQTAASPGISSQGSVYVPAGSMPGGFSAVPLGSPLARSGWPKFRGNAANTGNAADLVNSEVKIQDVK